MVAEFATNVRARMKTQKKKTRQSGKPGSKAYHYFIPPYMSKQRKKYKERGGIYIERERKRERCMNNVKKMPKRKVNGNVA